jgi:hypothetical protein
MREEIWPDPEIGRQSALRIRVSVILDFMNKRETFSMLMNISPPAFSCALTNVIWLFRGAGRFDSDAMKKGIDE